MPTAPAKTKKTTPKPAAAAQATSTATEPETPKWPVKGYDGPPPWELAAEHADPEKVGGEYPEPYTGPGAVTHSKPLLAEGTAGADVLELARRLAKLGYRENTISQGRNPGDVLDSSVMRSLNQFQNDYGIAENEDSFNGGSVPGRELVNRHVGPYTWQALITLTD